MNALVQMMSKPRLNGMHKNDLVVIYVISMLKSFCNSICNWTAVHKCEHIFMSFNFILFGV